MVPLAFDKFDKFESTSKLKKSNVVLYTSTGGTSAALCFHTAKCEQTLIYCRIVRLKSVRQKMYYWSRLPPGEMNETERELTYGYVLYLSTKVQIAANFANFHITYIKSLRQWHN